MVEGSSTTGREKLRNWRSACAEAAADQAELTGIIDTACMITVVFRFAMPKSRTKAIREQGHAWKVGKPDLDKLQRALGDSLASGGLIARDELIVGWHSSKVEVCNEWTGATIQVYSAGRARP